MKYQTCHLYSKIIKIFKKPYARSLSRSSWLLLSLLILALDFSLSRSFFHQPRYRGGRARKKSTKVNLASFRLWPPCCATPSSPSSSRVRAHAPTSNTASHDNHEKINLWVSFVFLYGYGTLSRSFSGAPLKTTLLGS